MDADAPSLTPCRKPPASHSLPPPPPQPSLFAVRSRSRSQVADLGGCAGAAAFSGPPDTPPRCSPLTVPFLWEDAPGKPKAAPPPRTVPEGGETGGDRHDSGDADQARHPLPPALKLPPRLQQVPSSSSFAAAPDTTLMSPDTVLQGPYYGYGGDRQGSGSSADQAARPLPAPLKLPPRLQRVPAPSSFAAADTPLSSSSPNTVLPGPCYGYGSAAAASRSKPPRWARSASAAFRRTTSAGVGVFLSRTWSKPSAAAAPGSKKNRGGDRDRDAAGPDAPWGSPASSSSASSSSVSTCFGGGDDHGRGRPADGREVCSEEDDGDGSPRGSVRIRRIRRNRSLPSMTTTSSNLLASIRRSVKQITPWS